MKEEDSKRKEDISSRKKFWKNFEKGVDKTKEMWYNIKVADKKAGNEHSKRFEKNLKKYLTNRKECDIINKLSSREASEKRTASWKLNNAKKSNDPWNFFDLLKDESMENWEVKKRL